MLEKHLPMRLVSIQVGRPRLVMMAGQPHSTGIFKAQIEGPVMARRLNLDGDRQANLEVHGGEHNAVYAYPSEHYPAWRSETGRDDLVYGQFGENFATEGLTEKDVCIGDRIQIGAAIFEISQPRIPCANLALRMQDQTFPKRFLKSQRSGFYLRVIDEGEVRAGDAIEWASRDPASLSVHAIHTLAFFDRGNAHGIECALSISALAPEWRRMFAKLRDSAAE